MAGIDIVLQTQETLRNVRDGLTSEEHAIAFLLQLDALEVAGLDNEAGVATSWDMACSVSPKFKRLRGQAAKEKMFKVAAMGFDEPWFLFRLGFLQEDGGDLDAAYDAYSRIDDTSDYYADAEWGMGRVEERRVDPLVGLKGQGEREKAIATMQRALQHYERALAGDSAVDPTRELMRQELITKRIRRCRDVLKPGFFNPLGIQR